MLVLFFSAQIISKVVKTEAALESGEVHSESRMMPINTPDFIGKRNSSFTSTEVRRLGSENRVAGVLV